MTSIYLIRHGQTDWNIDGRYQGQADPPLNKKGLEQAEQLVDNLKNEDLELVYTSPLLRAKQTAEILTDHLMIPLKEDPRLMEIHQGEWQTKLRAEIQASYPDVFKAWETNPWEVTPPGGENLFQVQERVNSVVDDITKLHPAHKVGVVTHRIPIALIKVQYQDLDPDIVRSIHLPNIFWEEIVISKNE